MLNKIYTVSGMTCSACSQRVERATDKIDGVKSCSVNLVSGVMKVEMEYDVGEKIISAITNEGYGIKEGVERNKVSEREKSLKKRLIISVPLLITLMYVAMANMLGLPFPKFLEKPFLFAVVQAVIALVIVIVNFSYYKIGFKNLIKLNPNMDSLVALGSSASFLYGVFAIIMIALEKDVHRYTYNLYFEGSAMIVTLITLGKFLEEKSKNKTANSVEKLLGLAPDKATVIRGGKEQEIAINELIEGDLVVLKDGFSIPADCQIVDGEGWVDESVVTGESIPVYKEKGSFVVCGTIFSGGYATAIAKKVGEDTTVSKIVKLVEDANSTKVPIASVADKISRIFVPTVIFISLIVFIVWFIISKDFAYAFNFAVSVLVISCPCALGLATPMALMVGTGKGAENGILIKNGESLQKFASVDTVVLDKTGTITDGKPQVTHLKSFIERQEFLKICASLEEKSSHVLGKAVLLLAKSEDVGSYAVYGFEAVKGKGVTGEINGEKYYLGSLAFIRENVDLVVYENAEKQTENENGSTLLILTTKTKMIGYMSIKDTIKVTSKLAVSKLKEMKIQTLMLTGDNLSSAKSVATELGIEYKAEVLPEDKHREIERLNEQGKTTAMVGDGVNDAPALAVASVGIAIGAGTDIAIESADVILMRNDLTDVANGIKLGKKVIKNIKENLFWAFFYNILLIPIASGVLSGIGIVLNPMIASVGMSVSSLFVVGNALRLRFIKFENSKGERDMFFKKKDERVAVIEGMMCQHCQKRVEGVFEKLGIKVEINLKKKTAVFSQTEVSDEQIKKAIESEGYTVVSIN